MSEITTVILDELEMKIEINYEFVICRLDYEEMKEKIEAIIEEYRI